MYYVCSARPYVGLLVTHYTVLLVVLKRLLCTKRDGLHIVRDRVVRRRPVRLVRMNGHKIIVSSTSKFNDNSVYALAQIELVCSVGV
jgi:hypothetical protein